MKFMACYDGSEESKEALRAAQHHAKVWGAKLEVANTITRVEPLKHSQIKKAEDKLEAEVKDLRRTIARNKNLLRAALFDDDGSMLSD